MSLCAVSLRLARAGSHALLRVESLVASSATGTVNMRERSTVATAEAEAGTMAKSRNVRPHIQ